MPLTAGTRLGSYEIGAPLGRGGVGEVYRAWDPRLEREVALKILHERSEVDPDRVWRFVAEARAASALNHPNILTVFCFRHRPSAVVDQNYEQVEGLGREMPLVAVSQEPPRFGVYCEVVEPIHSGAF